MPRSLAPALVFILHLFCAPLSADAQDPFRGWQWQNPLPQGNSINSIRFSPDKKRGWAIGTNGVVLTTKNGGFEWEEQTQSSKHDALRHVRQRPFTRSDHRSARRGSDHKQRRRQMGVATKRRSRASFLVSRLHPRIRCSVGPSAHLVKSLRPLMAARRGNSNQVKLRLTFFQSRSLTRNTES